MEQQAYAGGVKDINGDVLFGTLLREIIKDQASCSFPWWNCHNMGGARWFSIRAVKQSSILNEVRARPEHRSNNRHSALNNRRRCNSAEPNGPSAVP